MPVNPVNKEDDRRLCEKGASQMLHVKMSWLIGIVVLTAMGAQTRSEPGPPIGPDKKLLGWAMHQHDEDGSLREHIAEMEAILPLDGLIVAVYPDNWRAQEQKHHGCLWFSGGRKFVREDFRQTLANLKAIKFRRFTDNFVYMETAVRRAGVELRPGEQFVDWFDHKWLQVIAGNTAVAAYVAKEAGFKGILLDVESYSGGVGPWERPFAYDRYAEKTRSQGLVPRTLAATTAQVRRRGREFMQAITGVYPDITILVIPNLAWGKDPSNALLPAFVDGMLETRGQATLIDGLEGAYPYISHQMFSRLKQTAKQKGRQKSQRPKLYEKDIQYGFGLWVDHRVPGPFAWYTWYNQPQDFEKNYRSPKRFEHALYNAFVESDKYVWLYAMRHTMWSAPYNTDSKYGRIHEAYLEAIRNSRKPHDLDWSTKRVRELEAPVLANAPWKTSIKPEALVGRRNLLKSEGCESWPEGEDHAPGGWTLTREGPKVLREETMVKEGSYSARFTTSSKGFVHLMQKIPVKSMTGKTITFGVWNRPGAGEVVPQIVDHNPRHSEENVIRTFHEGADGWVFAAARKQIRKDATGDILFIIKVCFPSPATVIYVDGDKAVVTEE